MLAPGCTYSKRTHSGQNMQLNVGQQLHATAASTWHGLNKLAWVCLLRLKHCRLLLCIMGNAAQQMLPFLAPVDNTTVLSVPCKIRTKS